MHVLQIAVILASFGSVCLTRRQAIGSSCKGTGTCETKGTCPNDVIGKCCGGLDCCGCQGVETPCGSGNQGVCVVESTCSGSSIPGECCEGLECCQDCPVICGLGSGTCVEDGSCLGIPIDGNCCEGYGCCTGLGVASPP